jgi:P-type Cu2+ transporter
MSTAERPRNQEPVDRRLHATPDRTTLACVHCGEPTDCGFDVLPEEVFCCNGCRGAYELIHGWGLSEFYALRDQLRKTGPARPAGLAAQYEQFDSPEFLGPATPVQHSDGLCSTELALQGLHCSACAWLIERAATQEPGLRLARVKMSDHTVQIVFDPQQTRLSDIARFLDSLGYQLAPFDKTREKHLHAENRRLLTQIAIAGFLMANAMWIAVALYAGDFSGLAPDFRYFMGLVGTALGVASVAGPGRTFFVGALASIRARVPHMDLPVALGLGVGTVVGTINALMGSGHVYFDTLTTLVFLLLIGRWIQFHQQQRAARAVDLMLRITPRHASLINPDGSASLVMVERLEPGNRVRVAAGESLPADGIVVDGQSQLDRSLLTGESLPMSVQAGDEVAAGTVNLTSPLDIEITALGRDSRIGKVMQSVEAAAAEKTPIVQLADKVGGIFVVVVTLLAIVTFGIWASSGLALATAHSTALLIVACPCALALATPLAISVGLGRAARASILIRDGQSLQKLSSPGTLWLDKTGTLTAGRQVVAQVAGEVEGLRLAASIEQYCRHPVAEAILREARRRKLVLETEARLDKVQNGGIVGEVQGSRLVIGNAPLMAAHAIELDENSRCQMDALVQQGASPVWIAVDGRLVTLLGVVDPLRDGALEMVQELTAGGWKLGVLSGDHPSIVRKVAEQLRLPLSRVHGGLTPEEKLAAIRESRSAGETVVMVGDGANDAAALAAADVGVAVRGGAEVSLQAAPIFIASNKLSSLANLVRGSRRTTQLIYLSFAVSLSYNLIAVALAMLGMISPLAAAILMPISSVSVLAVTFAFKSFDKEV